MICSSQICRIIVTDETHKEPPPSRHSMNAIESFMRSRLEVATEHGTSVTGHVPDTRSLKDLVGAVPRCEDVDRASRCWGLEKT